MTAPRLPRSGQTTRLVLGVVPTRTDDGARTLLNDLCSELGRITEIAIMPHRAPSVMALASAITAGRVHIAWVSPTLYMLSDQAMATVPLLRSVRSGIASYHAALYTRVGSAVSSLDRLAGSRAAWVDRTSAAGYLFPRNSLARRGVDVASVFSAETFLGSHTSVAHAVFQGRADVGATFVNFAHGDPRRAVLSAGYLDTEFDAPVQILDIAGPVPSDMVVVVNSLALYLRDQIAQAFLSLARNPATQHLPKGLMNVDDFEVIRPSMLDDLTRVMKIA